MPWSCPRSTAAGLPIQGALTATFNAEIAASPDFVATIARAAQNFPDTDYWACLNRWLDSLRNELRAHGLEAAHSTEALTTAVRIYGRDSYARGALSPVEPAASNWLAPTARFREEASVELGCQAAGPEALDENVLKSLEGFLTRHAGECASKLADSYAALLRDAALDSPQCTAHADACAKRNHAIARALDLLSRAGLTPYDPYLSQRGLMDACFLDDWLEGPGPLEFLALTQRSIESSLVCRHPSEPGQAFRIDDALPDLRATYVIGRLSDERGPNGQAAPHYMAVLNYKMIGADGKPDDVSRKAEQDLRACYLKYADLLRGPEGERIEFRLQGDAPQDWPIGPEIRVTVGKTGLPDRADALHWPENETCGTLLHETLHEFGIPDYYAENSIGHSIKEDGSIQEVNHGANIPNQDCRSLGPEDSLMRGPGYALNSAPTAVKLSRDNRAYHSLLYPAEFRVIVYPGCVSKNRVYYACSRGAYMTSRGALGQADSCPKFLPPECQDPAKWTN